MKTLIKILALGLSICAGVAGAKFFFAHKLPNSNRGLYGACEMGGIDNLFVGSSMFRKGIDLGAVSEKLGGHSYILTYNGNQPVSILLELESILRSGAKIKNIYMDMYVFSLFSEPKLSDERLIWDLAPGDSIKLFNILCANREDKLRFAYSYFVTSNMRYLATYPISNYLISKRYKNGATTSEVVLDGLTKERAATLDLSYLDSSQSTPDKDQVDAVLKIIKLAGENGINLIFVDTIKYGPVYNSQKYKSMISEYERILDGAGAKYIRIENIPFSEECGNFLDGVHLSGAGARDFTLMLCEELYKKGFLRR